MLIARRGNDVAFLPENTEYYWQDSGTWYKKDGSPIRFAGSSLTTAELQTERRSTVKGYIRRVGGGKLGDVEGLGDSASGLTTR